MKKKNLEAENEIYKGLFRTPISFLLGGPYGLFVNTLYTIFRGKSEIQKEEEHKRFIESQFKQTVDLTQVHHMKEKEEEKAKEVERSLYDILLQEFDECEYVSKDDKNYWFQYHSKYNVYNKKPQKCSLLYGKFFNKKSVGWCYEIDEFYNRYLKDKTNNNIKEKYRFVDHTVCFLYITNSNELICTKEL